MDLTLGTSATELCHQKTNIGSNAGAETANQNGREKQLRPIKGSAESNGSGLTTDICLGCDRQQLPILTEQTTYSKNDDTMNRYDDADKQH